MKVKECVTKIMAGEALRGLSLKVEGDVIYNTDIQRRLYMAFGDGEVIISDNLHEIENEFPLIIYDDAKAFYQRYGFILPPFTLYKGIYRLAPYLGICLTPPFRCMTRYPEIVQGNRDKITVRSEIEDDIRKILNDVDGNYQVLFSGGLDSSLLLGVAHELGKAEAAINCFMSSMPEESIRAQTMCESKGIPFRKVLVSDDLTEIARQFIHLTAEPVADKIALVIPALLSTPGVRISSTILDGQGADSLFSGLPHDKLYDLYSKSLYRNLGRLLGWIPVWKKKNSPLGRKLYRITKVLHCLAAPKAVPMLIRSLVENEAVTLSADNQVQNRLNQELNSVHQRLGDFHLVIRYFFMYRMLPAREMQKYALSESLGIVFKLPFLETETVNKYFYVSPSFSIKERVYKHPIVSAAKQYWPGCFNSSRTSPFQVEFETGGLSVSEFSLNTISDNK